MSWKSALQTLPKSVVEVLGDVTTTDININPNGTIYTKGFGEGRKKVGEIDPVTAERFIRYVASSVGKTITPQDPTIDGYISEANLRIEGSVIPASPSTGITIRKLANVYYTLEDYLKDGILKERVYKELKTAIKEEANIVIIGPTGTGKTTMLNACLNEVGEIDPNCRIITAEDTQELRVLNQNWWANFTTEKITLAEQVTKSLRRDVDRFIVGEVRDGAFYDVLTMWNTGHSGGFVTLHAGVTEYKARKKLATVDLIEDALERMLQMVGERVANVEEQKRKIASAIDVIVCMKTTSLNKAMERTGKRKSEIKIGDVLHCHKIANMRDYDESEKRFNYITIQDE